MARNASEWTRIVIAALLTGAPTRIILSGRSSDAGRPRNEPIEVLIIEDLPEHSRTRRLDRLRRALGGNRPPMDIMLLDTSQAGSDRYRHQHGLAGRLKNGVTMYQSRNPE